MKNLTVTFDGKPHELLCVSSMHKTAYLRSTDGDIVETKDLDKIEYPKDSEIIVVSNFTNNKYIQPASGPIDVTKPIERSLEDYVFIGSFSNFSKYIKAI